ncbi:MAG: hypothetical protein KDA24_14530 [Deltaproteobacteria bacterium]|nr:hypothetical protein [Deltaproteobacteria bacterium]
MSKGPSSHAASVIAGIQRHLEAIYAVEAGHEIERFLIGDAEVDALVDGGVLSEGHRGAAEQVLLLPGDGTGLELALHLGDTVQAGLAAGSSLQHHCHATEGVSHVLMILLAARRERSIRLLDLELQAEVDKAATCLLLARGAPGNEGRHILRRLFGGVELRRGLEPAERARYLEAHKLGARYAGYLAEVLTEGVDRLLGELRRFYRLPAEGKRERARAA